MEPSDTTNHYRERYFSEYTVSLKGAAKLNRTDNQASVGDYVLSKEPNLKRENWSLFKVVQTFIGVDNQVRSELVENSDGQTSTRAVKNLVLLPQRAGECVNDT